MKKTITLLLAVFMIFSAFCASAKTPEFLKETYNNYTADYKTSVSFESGDDICSLLEELGALAEIEKYVDVSSLLEGIFGIENTINVQCNMSEDFKKIDIALTTSAVQNISVNPNLSASLAYGQGVWMHADFAKDQPECTMVYATPFSNKYAIVDVMNMAPAKELSEIGKVMEAIFTPEFIKTITDYGADALAKYAHITQRGNTCRIHLTNDNFMLMLEEFLAVVVDMTISAVEDLPKEYGEFAADEVKEAFDALSLKGLKLLGKDGITWDYELNPQGKIRSAALRGDIGLEIANIYELISGEKWPYSSRGVIDFNVNMTMDVTNIGKTTPKFPELTEDNSYYYEFEDYSMYEDYEYVNYPNSFVYIDMDNPIEKDGVEYFPLEETLYDCYTESIAMESSDTTITMTSDYFRGFTYVTVSVGKNVAITDNAEYNIGEVIEEEGRVYVSRKFFEDVFGWELDEYTVDLVTGSVSCSFDTNTDSYFDMYDYEEMEYPYEYVWGNVNSLPVYSGATCVPLRKTLESGYDDEITITYLDGTITLESPWFDKFNTVVITLGSNVVYVDGVPFTVDAIYEENGATYVSPDFFTDIFGWKLEYYYYDRVNNQGSYEFFAGDEY